MGDETDLWNADQPEELVSSEGDGEGFGSETSGSEPEGVAVSHGYYLRHKRAVTGAAAASRRNKKDVIAPGEGVVADHNRVGGRDERVLRKSYGANAAAESSDAGRSETGAGSGGSSRSPSDQALSDSHGSLPRLRNERLGTTLRRRLPATPLFAGMSREELEAQSPRVMALLRKSKPERVRMLSSPTNELAIRRDSSRPSDAGRKAKSRIEPGASDLLGQVPVKPGRGLFSDNTVIQLLYRIAANDNSSQTTILSK